MESHIKNFIVITLKNPKGFLKVIYATFIYIWVESLVIKETLIEIKPL